MKRGITTGNGDQGRTRLLSGVEVWKYSPWTEALGDLDELNSLLGWARVQMRFAGFSDFILKVQHDIIRHAGRLDGTVCPRRPDLDDEIALLEAEIHRHHDEMEMPKRFVQPGDSPGGAALDVARSVARRAERHIVAALAAAGAQDADLLVWINRLSDVLWLMARREDASG